MCRTVFANLLFTLELELFPVPAPVPDYLRVHSGKEQETGGSSSSSAWESGTLVVCAVGAASAKAPVNDMTSREAGSTKSYEEPVIQAFKSEKSDREKDASCHEKQKDFAFLVDAGTPAKARCRQ